MNGPSTPIIPPDPKVVEAIRRRLDRRLAAEAATAEMHAWIDSDPEVLRGMDRAWLHRVAERVYR